VLDGLREYLPCLVEVAAGIQHALDSARLGPLLVLYQAIEWLRDGARICILVSEKDLRLDIENARLRELLAQAGIDAAEHKLVQGLQRLLLEELHHRIKNLLGTVMAIASQSLRNANSVEHGREAIEHRLRALGRVQDLLLKVNWESASLSSIIQTAVEPFDKGSRFSIKIPDIEVSPSAVLPLAMILNELCTNAVKYGALSNANGCVEISAIVDASNERFVFRWAEIGGPPVRIPARQSFGTQLIEQDFVGELRGEAHLSFEPSGVVCKLDIPLVMLIPVKPTEDG
jgi:two-component sensor histidine kinase